MLKTQYPANHLKKEGVNSRVTELSDEMQYIEQAKEFPQFKRYRRSDVDSESGSRIKRIDVPGDGSCLFWSVTMAYLIPVRNDDALFRQRYEVLFGNDGTITQNLDHIRGLVRNLGAANYDDTFANLVRNVFRNRVVDHISSHGNEFRGFIEGNFESYLENMRKPNAWGGEPEIRAMSGMLRATISVSGATESRYENGNIQIQLFHVGALGKRNHYNFGLERGTVDNDVELAKGLKKVMGKGRPQDFELIQLLIEEAGTEVGTSKQEEDFRSFETRFQSFVDQIPSYLHSVEKAGFFAHFFLGSFSTLLDTKIAERLDIKKIYFSFDTSKTLKVAIVKNGQIGNAEDAINNIDLFSISEGKRGHQFTVNELESILRNNIDRSKIRDRNVEQNIKNEIQDRIKSRLVQIYKGKDGIFVNMEVKEILDSPASKEFHEVEKGIWNNPEGDIAKLSDSDAQTVSRSLKKVLEKINNVHSEYVGSVIYDNSAREAAHHGFMVGVFMNFHYRYNLRVYPEQFAGRGYADIILLARGPDRALDSIPIIIELKAGEGPNATPDKALQQAERYAQGFQPNVQRVLTTADNILCVGVNLDNPSPISDVRVSNRRERIIPLFQDMLKSSDDWDTQEIYTNALKKRIKNNIERIYHTFPGTPEKGDNHYFSRFLLGQSLLLNRIEDLKTGFKKYIFIYGNNIPTEVHPNLRGPGRLAAQRSREALSTNLDASHAVVTMVLIPENTKKLVYVINIVEANRKDVLNGLNEELPLDRLNREIGNREIVELNLNFDTRYKSDFKRYLTIWTEKYNSLQEYNNGADRFQGTFKEVPYPSKLKETFDQALDAQSLSIDEYNKLLEKIGEGIFPFKSLVNKEAHFQGILNGVFSYYSDLKLQESPETRALVLTEFQTGRGERIDMLVHGIKFVAQGGNAEEYTPVGLELKTSRQGKGAQALLREANDQINEEYKEGVTYKTLTDGDEVKFIGVVFDKGSNNPNKLILTSRTTKEGFIPVEVVHSSVHMLPTVGQCSKREPSSPGYPPSKKPRRERSVSMACIDSFDEEKITEEEKEQRIKELFNADKVAERVKNIEFYDQLFKVSQKISKGEIIDKNVEEAFVAKIKDIDLDSIDPEIRDIVKEMKDNIENKEEVKNILRRSGVAERIGKVAEGAGLAFTVFLVGKHIANGDIEGLGYDALNLWVMPKIGEKISGKMLELGTKLDSQMLRGFAPVMGRAIGNFAAFLGLAESIKARQSATDPVDIKIADLNIATNSIFIAADVPAVVTETMSAIGIEAGIIGEFAGPVGAAVSVAVIIIAQFVEAGLQVKKLEEQIDLTDQEKHQFYWKFFLEQEIPDYIQDDIKAKAIYGKYISNILEQFKNNYDIIAMSLPSILVVEEEYSDKSYGRRRRHYEANEMILHPEQKLFEVLNGVSVAVPNSECRNEKKFITSRLNSKLMADIKYPFNTDSINHYSRLIPNAIGDYKMACGPLANEIKEEKIQLFIFDHIPKVSCKAKMKLDRRLLQWSLQEYTSGCYNSVVYRNKNSRGYGSMYHMPFQNIKIDVVYDGKNASEKSNKVENRYYFGEVLDRCRVYNPGSNFFYITGKFSCDLGVDEQKNIVITQGNLTTNSINIHSVVGSNKANHIKVSYAGYVDGKGGNDVITAKNFATIKGYFGDYIYGKGLVLLPINLSDIGNITHANNITNIYNKSGAFISVDKQILVKTADGSFVTPTKVDANTGRVTNLQITKLDDKLDNLQKIDNSNFNITKQLLSADYHSTIGGSSNHIFYPDKEHHNFYWEAPSNISHLYLFDHRNANITIAQANGILDFSQLNCTLDDMPLTENNEGEIKINRNSLHVTLLPNYKDVTVTFDGQEYYKLQNGELERDYCSHSLKVDGRFSVNGTNLLNHHNCFTFDSDKVLFLKLNNDLLLLSDRGALSISDYYSSVHKNWDLSIELSDKIMEPEEFEERADDFSSFRYYKPDEQGLQIYHNQPIDNNDIGLVDLKGKSILDLNMKVMNDTLLLSHKNNTLVKVESWNTYQPAREMMFAFNDAIVFNSKCIASTCNSEDIIEELHKEKGFLLEHELFNAVEQNNFDKVKELVNQGANINAKDKDDKTPLDLATQKGYEDIVRILKQTQLDLDKELLINAQDGDLNKVKDLIAHGASLEAKDDNGSTPLHYAAWNDQLGVVIYLVENGASLKVKNRYNKAPLYDAFSNCHLDIVEYCTKEGTGINAVDYVNATDQYGWTPLHWAASKGCLEVAKFLIEKGADINAEDMYGKKPIQRAAEDNNKNIIELLLGKGVSVNEADKDGWTPLYWPSWNGNLDVVKYLIDKGASINAKDKGGKTPLDIAVDKKHVNVEQYLRQVQLDKKLLFAVGSRELNEIKNLISQGANLEAKDGDGSTPLYIASRNNYLDVLEYLVKSGANLEAKNRYGRTPLFIASWNGHLDIVKYLVENGANLEAKDYNGRTPLCFVSAHGRLDIVKWLVENGANLEAKDYDGETPLYLASVYGRLDVVKYLVSKGADIDADNNGKTSLDIARYKEHSDIIACLQQAQLDNQLLTAVRSDDLNAVKDLVARGASLEAKDKDGKTPLGIAIDKKHNNVERYLRQVQLDKKLLFAVVSRELNEIKNLISHGANLEAKYGDGSTPLHIASRNNYLDVLEYLIKSGANLEAKDRHGRTPLFIASWNGNLDVIKYLVKNGANLETGDYNGRTPLCFASAHSRLDIVKWLVENGANLEAKDYNDETPLYLASVYGRLDVVKYLISKGANIDADNGGKTSLDIARYKGHSDIVVYLQQTQLSLDKQLFTAVQDGNLNKVKDLVSRGANLDAIDIHDATDDNNYGWTPILYAAKGSKWDVVKLLISNGAKFNNEITYQGTPLHFAVQENDLGMVQFLLNKGAKVESEDSYNRKPLHLAAEVSGLNIMKLLLGNGANVDAIDMYRQTPLYFAIDKDKSDVVKLLLDSGANVDVVDVNGQTPLYLAKQERHAGIVKILEQAKLNQELLTVTKIGDLSKVKDSLKQGADINAEDKDGNTSLHNAASKGYLNVVQYLIEKGASLEAKDHDSRTPIYDASWNGHLDIVKCLIEKGVNVNATDKNGWTPLHWAASKGNLEIAKSLIEKGADINAKNIYGKKPIHRAAEKNYETVIELLLSKGANVNDTDKSGWTPLHWASQNGHLDVVKYLVNRGAEVNAKANDGKTPLDIAIEQKHNNVVEYLKKVKEERGKPVQRRRRHHHGDHNRHYGHLSRKPLAIDLSNQPEIATSSAARRSSWINDVFGWVKSSVSGLLSSKPRLSDETSSTSSPISQVDAKMDVNGTIMLLDLLIRKVTGQKYISTVDQSISPLEAQGYALNITKEFEKVVEQAGLKSGVSMHRLNIDYMEMQKEITRKVMSGKFNEISGILNSYVEKACPGREAGYPGKLSSKKFDKFMLEFNSRLNVVLDQSIQQILHNIDGTLEVVGAKKQQMSLKPQSYLSNASVHSHSKVSTCLSEIGVTKLGNTLSK